MVKDALGTRMKEYEHSNRVFLDTKLPVIIRIDGKAFHTYTKGFQKPFDYTLFNAMRETARLLCENIQGAKIGFTQSDEITIFVNTYESPETQAWFGNNKSKIESISASMATAFFNNEMNNAGVDKIAFFDSRAFTLPKDEITNNFIWRQQDAIRNSISSLAQAHFSHKELNGVKSEGMLEKLLKEKSVDWFSLPVNLQRGSTIIKEKQLKEVSYNDKTFEVERNVWVIDNETPIFTQDRDYVERFV